MESSSGNGAGAVKKQEDGGIDAKGSGDKRDIKPVVRTLNRVPRACNACRKQKMRCEGADNPPCRRCKHAGLECLFEKPSREATLTGEAGLERIRSLEAHVADIRVSQASIQSGIAEIVAHLRAGAQSRSPSNSQALPQQSPSVHSVSPSMSTPPAGSAGAHMNDIQHHSSTGLVSAGYATHGPLPSIASSTSQRQPRNSISNPTYRSPPLNSSDQKLPNHAEYPPPQQSSTYATYPNVSQPYHTGNAQGPVLPPFSSIQTMGTIGSQQSNMSSVRYHSADNGMPQKSQYARPHNSSSTPSSMRHAAGSSNVTSADSSDLEDDDNGELPASGLVAPWEVLRGLADVAIERASKENGDSSEPQSRARTPSPDRQSRPSKRRKIRHKPRTPTFPDVVTKNIISDSEAQDLFRIFYHGCSTFLPVFDANTDSYDALHERSPFAVDCICMVAARVRDGGGKASDVYLRCLEEVQAISRATLFSPVTRNEAVQAMILVAGWSDNGWLSGGHAVRMAMELSMHKAWPKLLRRMKTRKSADISEDRELVIQSRIWFCLYLFEHQLSYGTGRPAILKDDESIWQCRQLLTHPLAIEDDMRLVSTVELMAIREKVNNKLSPFERPVEDETFHILHEAATDFSNWYITWDNAFSQKYEDAAFYRQSLQIQHFHAELFHNATALRGINGPDDVQKMHPMQRNLAVKSIQIARKGLDVTVRSPAYREGMKYAVHYTHATATFAASFLLRLARLFPEECNPQDIRTQVETLASLMAEIPGKRYALTLQVMLKKRERKRKATLTSIPPIVRPPKVARESRPVPMPLDPSNMIETPHARVMEEISPTYETPFTGAETAGVHPTHMPIPVAHQLHAEHIWRGFEMTSNAQLPVWLSDESLGGNSFSQNGMDAFLLPSDYLPVQSRIW